MGASLPGDAGLCAQGGVPLPADQSSRIPAELASTHGHGESGNGQHAQGVIIADGGGNLVGKGLSLPGVEAGAFRGELSPFIVRDGAVPLRLPAQPAKLKASKQRRRPRKAAA